MEEVIRIWGRSSLLQPRNNIPKSNGGTVGIISRFCIIFGNRFGPIPAQGEDLEIVVPINEWWDYNTKV
jgi:hypothetical protein